MGSAGTIRHDGVVDVLRDRKERIFKRKFKTKINYESGLVVVYDRELQPLFCV